MNLPQFDAPSAPVTEGEAAEGKETQGTSREVEKEEEIR
jgi:hypothetical protein